MIAAESHCGVCGTKPRVVDEVDWLIAHDKHCHNEPSDIFTRL